jgi:hypothetical protein
MLVELAEGLEGKKRAFAQDVGWDRAAAISPGNFDHLHDQFLLAALTGPLDLLASIADPRTAIAIAGVLLLATPLP